MNNADKLELHARTKLGFKFARSVVECANFSTIAEFYYSSTFSKG